MKRNKTGENIKKHVGKTITLFFAAASLALACHAQIGESYYETQVEKRRQQQLSQLDFDRPIYVKAGSFVCESSGGVFYLKQHRSSPIERDRILRTGYCAVAGRIRVKVVWPEDLALAPWDG